jgi:hypothetical protein
VVVSLLAGGVAGAAVLPESAGAAAGGVEGAGVGAAIDGDAGELVSGAAAGGVAGASSRLLQPARTAASTAAANTVWRTIILCLLRVVNHECLLKFRYFRARLFPFKPPMPVRKYPDFM